ncbi:hypothetical protein [Polaribacter sp. WD7]|uniref:hypothetical protein n=1 Tax=Polaribacter sp. WD7 TaxID=2269061 RepID=UPI0026996FEF|nr:hypothetical protein [Polaribacter sp. WD7]
MMTVDILSSIKGAKESEAVSKLFDAIKSANVNNIDSENKFKNAVSLDDLREDVVLDSSTIEKEIIIENFPKKKNGYLVVAKVIEE